jgi:hypothetical protein
MVIYVTEAGACRGDGRYSRVAVEAVAYGVTRGEHGQVEKGSQKAADTLSTH